MKSQNTKPEFNYSENIDTVASIKSVNTSNPDRISDIRNLYKEINDCIGCIDKKYDFDWGWISIRLQQDNIKKVILEGDVAGDFTFTYEFYLENKDLFFVYEVFFRLERNQNKNRIVVFRTIN